MVINHLRNGINHLGEQTNWDDPPSGDPLTSFHHNAPGLDGVHIGICPSRAGEEVRMRGLKLLDVPGDVFLKMLPVDG